MKSKIEYDDEGNYRLIIDDRKGEWTAYNKVACVGNFVAFSEYWDLPLANNVFGIVEEVSVIETRNGVKPK